MKKVYIGVGAAALFGLLLVGAFAFSMTLYNLRVNAFSFTAPVAAPVIAAPMTFNEESQLSKPQANVIRFDIDPSTQTTQPTERLCHRHKAAPSPQGSN